MTELFQIGPLCTEEMNDFIRFQWDAFAPINKDMITPMAFPLGPRSDMLQRFREDLVTATATGQQVDVGDDGSFSSGRSSCAFTCKDVRTGEIVGVSRWSANREPPRSEDEIEKSRRALSEARRSRTAVVGCNVPLLEALTEAGYAGQANTMASHGPHMSLELLAVATEHQRKVIGSQLLRNGFGRFDRFGVPCYLSSGLSGKGVV